MAIKKRVIDYTKYMCKKCGFLYDPKYGDQESNVNPLTNFNEIPDDWKCPICNSDKTDFEVFTHL